MSCRYFFLYFFACFCGLLFSGGSSLSVGAAEPAQIAGKTQSPEKEYYETMQELYVLGSGDELKITVFGEDELSGVYAVLGGSLSFPLIGEVDVRNLSIREAEKKIAGLLADGYIKNPNISIEVLKFSPFYVMGEVRSPGSYDYTGEMTVLKAIAVAGGYTYRANKKTIEILRTNPGEGTILENVHDETKVIPGDIINVKERFF